MKKIIFPMALVALLTACNNGDAGKKDPVPEKKETTGTTTESDYEKGLALVGQSDCFTCHKVDEELTGPTYRAVAEKYAGLPDTIVTHLAGKIINGGNGVWGETFMTPHAGVSEEDAKAMVKYILTLKK